MDLSERENPQRQITAFTPHTFTPLTCGCVRSVKRWMSCGGGSFLFLGCVSADHTTNVSEGWALKRLTHPDIPITSDGHVTGVSTQRGIASYFIASK